VIAILGVIKPCTCRYTRPLRFWYPADARILTHSVNSLSGLNWASKTNVGLAPGSDFKMRPVYNSEPRLTNTVLNNISDKYNVDFENCVRYDNTATQLW